MIGLAFAVRNAIWGTICGPNWASSGGVGGSEPEDAEQLRPIPDGMRPGVPTDWGEFGVVGVTGIESEP